VPELQRCLLFAPTHKAAVSAGMSNPARLALQGSDAALVLRLFFYAQVPWRLHRMVNRHPAGADGEYTSFAGWSNARCGDASPTPIRSLAISGNGERRRRQTSAVSVAHIDRQDAQTRARTGRAVHAGLSVRLPTTRCCSPAAGSLIRRWGFRNSEPIGSIASGCVEDPLNSMPTTGSRRCLRAGIVAIPLVVRVFKISSQLTHYVLPSASVLSRRRDGLRSAVGYPSWTRPIV